MPSSVLKGMPSEATCCFENVENVQICPHFIAGFVWLFYIYIYAVAVLFGFEFKLLGVQLCWFARFFSSFFLTSEELLKIGR